MSKLVLNDTDRLNFLLNYISMSRNSVKVLGRQLEHDLDTGDDRDFIVGGSIRKLIDDSIRHMDCRDVERMLCIRKS